MCWWCRCGEGAVGVGRAAQSPHSPSVLVSPFPVRVAGAPLPGPALLLLPRGMRARPAPLALTSAPAAA